MKAKEVVDPIMEKEIVDFIIIGIRTHGLSRAQIIDVAQSKGYELTKKNYSKFHELAFKEIVRQSGVMGPVQDHEVSDVQHLRKVQNVKYAQKKESKATVKIVVPERKVNWNSDKEVLNFITKKDE